MRFSSLVFAVILVVVSGSTRGSARDVPNTGEDKGRVETGTNSVLLESNQQAALLGHGVSTAGDVNGDGFDEVIVGAYKYDKGQISEGVALIFLGSSAGLTGSSPADAHSVLESDQERAFFGYDVSTAGDVNGDGFDDVIVGAYYYDNGEPNEGAAFVFLGSVEGIVGSSPADAHALLESNQMGGILGNVSTAGDVNGDGFDDVIVGAPQFDNGGFGGGVALVFLGSAAGIVGSSPADAHAVLESNQADSWMGGSVATAGDVNDDGYGDVIVGASRYDNGESGEGAAFVFLGSASGIVGSSPGDAHAVLESDQVDGWMGVSVSAAGDVNADGYDDVIVGASHYDNGEANEGAAFVFLGSIGGIVGSSPASAYAMMESDQEGGAMGNDVATAGDVNGDGYDDLIVGVLGYEDGDYQEGAAFVFLGSETGIVGSSPADAHARMEGNQRLAAMGVSVSTAGDVNGDGFSEIVVGADEYNNGESAEGVAIVRFGSSMGLTGVFFDGFESGDTAGWSATVPIQ